MDFLNLSLTRFFDILLKPFIKLPPVYGLCFLSLFSGVVLLKMFGCFSKQGRIRKIKDRIKAHLLEIVLYRGDTRASLRAQFKMAKQGFVYLAHMLIPFVILIIPCLILLAQLNLRYGSRFFRIGEESIVSVGVERENSLDHFSISVTEGLKVLTPPLRIKEKNEIHWRMKAVKEGAQTITIHHQDQKYDKQVEVGQDKVKLVNGRYKRVLNFLFNPGEERLENKSSVTSIEIEYPQTSYQVFHLEFHWFAIFFVVSLLGGLISKRFLGIEV